MIRQLSNGGLKFKTPRLEYALPALSQYTNQSADFGYLVSEESLLQLDKVQIGVQFCGVAVDVLGFIQDVPFVVFVTYKDRALPAELKTPAVFKCGVVEFNLDAVFGLFKKEKKGLYKELLCQYIEQKTDGKTWAYHPREARLKEAAINKRQAWLLQQKTEAMATNNHRQSLKQEYRAPKLNLGKYICVMCKRTWEGTSRVCKKCNTHLYTTERE